MPPKGQRDTERSVTLTPQADATTLRLDLFASLSKWPTLEQALVKLLFRVGARSILKTPEVTKMLQAKK